QTQSQGPPNHVHQCASPRLRFRPCLAAISTNRSKWLPPSLVSTRRMKIPGPIRGTFPPVGRPQSWTSTATFPETRRRESGTLQSTQLVPNSSLPCATCESVNLPHPRPLSRTLHFLRPPATSRFRR